jgi:hypothetical protein
MSPKTAFRCLTLLAVLVTSFAASAPATSCPPPCRRSQCIQLCGSQGPAFCTVDEFGCSVCMCNG